MIKLFQIYLSHTCDTGTERLGPAFLAARKKLIFGERENAVREEGIVYDDVNVDFEDDVNDDILWTWAMGVFEDVLFDKGLQEHLEV